MSELGSSMKKILYLTLAVASTCSLADVSESSVQPTFPSTTSTAAVVNNSNANFIGRYNYFQNPYGWMLSGGGTSKLTESEIKEQNWAEKLFAGGTYNVFTGVTYNQWDGRSMPHLENLTVQMYSRKLVSSGGSQLVVYYR